MSLKRVLETLANLGLKRSDAVLYVFLAKKGPHTQEDLCITLNMSKQQLIECLQSLEAQGIVRENPERAVLFSAVPFERALDLLVKAKLDEAERTEKDKDEAIAYWQSMAIHGGRIS